MSNTYGPSNVPWIVILKTDEGRPYFQVVTRTLGEARSFKFATFTELAAMVKELSQFASTPWRQYWALSTDQPEIYYLGEFNDPMEAKEKLAESAYLHRDEMEVINCSDAASLLVSAMGLPELYGNPQQWVIHLQSKDKFGQLFDYYCVEEARDILEAEKIGKVLAEVHGTNVRFIGTQQKV